MGTSVGVTPGPGRKSRDATISPFFFLFFLKEFTKKNCVFCAKEHFPCVIAI